MPSIDFVFEKYTKAFPSTTRNARSVHSKFGSLYAYDGDTASTGNGLKYRRKMSAIPILEAETAAKREEHERLLEEKQDYRTADEAKRKGRAPSLSVAGYPSRRCELKNEDAPPHVPFLSLVETPRSHPLRPSPGVTVRTSIQTQSTIILARLSVCSIGRAIFGY